MSPKTASLTTQAFGMGISLYGALSAASAAQDAGDLALRMREEEARILLEETTENVARARADGRRELAHMRATLAGTGTVLSSGSNQAVLAVASNRIETRIDDLARQGRLDARRIRYQGQLERWQAGTTASSLRLGALTDLAGGLSDYSATSFRLRRSGALS